MLFTSMGNGIDMKYWVDVYGNVILGKEKDLGKKYWKGRRDWKSYVGILEKEFGEEC